MTLLKRLSLLLIAIAAPLLGSDLDGEFRRVREQFCEFYTEPGTSVANVLGYARSLGADGRWKDIDYASGDLGAWPPSNHYGRMVAMAIVRRKPGCTEADRALLGEAIHRAFAHWISRDYQAKNWWYNRIGAPKQMGALGLLLNDELLPEEHAYLTGVMLPRSEISYTAQNRVWMAGNVLNRGLLLRDPAPVALGSAAIWEELRVGEAEGIQPDWSFHQHGPQPQFGNYGLSLAQEMTRWGMTMRGTRWAMPEAQLAIYRNFILEGEAWTLWRGRMDLAACGRHLLPKAPRQKGDTLLNVARQASLIDPAGAARYQALIARNQPGAPNDLVGCRVFWRSDYLVQRRPDRMVSLRMSSRRVIGAESLNNENLQGYHLGDGLTCFYRNGDEYEEIFPVWDWRRLPGVTCAQGEGPLPSFKSYFLESDFVRAVSEGPRGVAAMDYRRDGVKARKAWFFAGDETVLLGCAIRSEGAAPVATTINQCLLRGEVTLKRAGLEPEQLPLVGASFTGVEWVEHDGWRYSFPDGATICLQTGPQSGNWRRVMGTAATPAADVTLPIFTLWIDHGLRPASATYACIVGPAGRAAVARVLANGEDLQAVDLGEGREGRVILKPAPDVQITSLCAPR